MRSLVFIILFVLVGCQTTEKTGNSSSPKTTITKADAIAIAEQFVKKQGYTQIATNISIDQAVFEDGEYASNISKLLETRHNLLQIPAYGARQYGELNKWAVAFTLSNSEENIGRAVIMDTLGQNIKLDKNPIRLDWIDEWVRDRLIDSLKRAHPDFVPR